MQFQPTKMQSWSGESALTKVHILVRVHHGDRCCFRRIIAPAGGGKIVPKEASVEEERSERFDASVLCLVDGRRSGKLGSEGLVAQGAKIVEAVVQEQGFFVACRLIARTFWGGRSWSKRRCGQTLLGIGEGQER